MGSLSPVNFFLAWPHPGLFALAVHLPCNPGQAHQPRAPSPEALLHTSSLVNLLLSPALVVLQIRTFQGVVPQES